MIKILKRNIIDYADTIHLPCNNKKYDAIYASWSVKSVF